MGLFLFTGFLIELLKIYNIGLYFLGLLQISDQLKFVNP